MALRKPSWQVTRIASFPLEPFTRHFFRAIVIACDTQKLFMSPALQSFTNAATFGLACTLSFK